MAQPVEHRSKYKNKSILLTLSNTLGLLNFLDNVTMKLLLAYFLLLSGLKS